MVGNCPGSLWSYSSSSAASADVGPDIAGAALLTTAFAAPEARTEATATATSARIWVAWLMDTSHESATRHSRQRAHGTWPEHLSSRRAQLLHARRHRWRSLSLTGLVGVAL